MAIVIVKVAVPVLLSGVQFARVGRLGTDRGRTGIERTGIRDKGRGIRRRRGS
jgi:hypothetical protein